MPYGLILLVSAIALSGVYVFATEASFWSKILVTGLLLASLVWRYGAFLQVGLGSSKSANAKLHRHMRGGSAAVIGQGQLGI